ncbi:hypothetical protein LTR95_012592 [Oleoguttula sp. CCFEE 5521]
MAAASGGGNIKVVVRVRPFNSREHGRNAKCVVSMDGEQTILSPPPAEGKTRNLKAALEGNKTFAFDKSYWSFNRKDPHFADQEDLFTDLGKPLLDNAFQGYNNCIFAYGQTGSGKSYSMMGYGAEEGVIPRICRDMFERIDAVHEDKNNAVTVEVSYLEIYNERVRDLLNPSTKGNLKVREHPATGPYVEDLAKLVVRSFLEIENLMDEGNKARTVAATNMNETSSRSHAVFTLTLTQKRHDAETNMDTEKVAKISLVDLAGSERATSTGATGARLKEGAEINRSLSTLGRVIAALADMSSAKTKTKGMQVPYRDSVLTWLLKDSLGGNSLTAMIAAISPADINFEETLSTLRYADSAKRIKNHAVVNEDPNARMIRELKEELAQLRSKLSTGGGAAEEQYSSDTPLEMQMVSITGADGVVKRVSKAEIADQLSQSEKLYKDLNQTWEEKLTMTEHIHKEREAALEELGISIEKGFIGLSTPKKMPHLVNLSDDPLLAECLVYNLKPGTTTVGNVETNAVTGEPSGEASSSVDIRLNGSKILHDHCTFENVDGIVTVVPKDGAAVMVNGRRIEAPERLRSGYRVIIGDFHIFRFNHPQEAREQRAEQGSLLKYAVTADQLDATPSRTQSRPGHERSSSAVSRAMSEIEDIGSPGTESPAPWRNSAKDLDWNFARREAASAILGSDQKISSLTDDQLDVLFEDLQRVRAVRKDRPESKLFDSNGGGDEDSDSTTSRSVAVREKYLSNGTLDNFSLDTALTVPTTPMMGGEDDRLKHVRQELQSQLDQQKVEYQQKLQDAEQSSVAVEEIKAEKAKMEDDLRLTKEHMQDQLAKQKAEFAKQIAELKAPRKLQKTGDGQPTLSERDIYLAKHALQHWRQQRYIAMAASILSSASALKEAQILSQQMGCHVVFQFVIVDLGHTFGSSYDLVLNGISAEETNDSDLEDARKPCLGVRIVDFNKGVVHLWSIEKLHTRLRIMRQLGQYLDRPEYMKHFRLGNPFEEDCMPEYTRIGDADIPLAAVFECRVQDFTLDVYSTHTCSVIGIVHLSVEPSSAEAPSSTLKFNVVMHELVGFPEREGTSVHAQLFIPGVSEEGGATTTSCISDFGEGAVRFESVHSMSLPLTAPRESSLRVSIFAKVTSMHLDKLLSWDDMRDASTKRPIVKRSVSGRIPEREYLSTERHDVFARIQVLEIGEDGTYQPVEVVSHNTLDNGAYQLHQGLQRRVVLDLTHNSGETLPWREVSDLRIGSVHLLDHAGKVSDAASGMPDLALAFISPPVIRTADDGTTTVKLTGQWDSSAHGSLLLDRPTIENYRVQLTLHWQVSSDRTTQPMKFSYAIAVQTRPRTWFRQNSILAQLWHNTRVVHSCVGNYSVELKPGTVKRAGDLWRMDTTQDYISGQEGLTGWAPRGVSLLRDFIELKRRRRRTAEVESAKVVITTMGLSSPTDRMEVDDIADLSEEQRSLLQRSLELWQAKAHDSELLILRSKSSTSDLLPILTPNGSSSSDGNGSAHDFFPALLAPTVLPLHKSPQVLKAGYLLSPNAQGTRWQRHYIELRRPYLHLYNSTGDELPSITLTNSRIDSEPEVGRLLERPNLRLEVFAIYGGNRAWLFAARNERERGEWIWAIDRGYGDSGGSSDGE